MRHVIWLLAVTPLLFPPFGHADPNYEPFTGPKGDHDAAAYWTDIHDYAPNWSIDKAGTFAKNLCMILNGGTSEGGLIAGAATNGMDFDAATAMVHAAEWHFCPNHY